MTPNVTDWFRSLGVFGTAFAAVVLFTVGVAAAIVPTGDEAAQLPAASSGDAGASGVTPIPTAPPQPTAVGGTLTVSGDREGAFVLARETTENRYGLVGPEGRVLFEGDPVTVARVQYDGLEFFIAPGDCTVTPGDRHDPTGVAGADIHCEAIEDVRGNGTINLGGRVGVAATLFGLRGDLPESGGTLTVDGEALEVGQTFVVIPTGGSFFGTSFFVGQIVTADGRVSLHLDYDTQTHQLTVSEINADGETVRPGGGCHVDEREIGVLNPHVRIVELAVRCDRVDLPSRGEIALSASVIVEMVEPPR